MRHMENSKKRVLILSDLHHRISGVSSSIRSLLPRMQEHYQLSFIAKKDAGKIKAISLLAVAKTLKNWSFSYDPIWHVRRNNEMAWGLLMRYFLCRRLKLVFTSAAIRSHSAWPRLLISKMDAVVATSTKAAAFIPNVSSVVPHGVDIGRFQSIHSSQDYEWSEFQLVIGIVGRVRPEKGTDIFSEALCQFLKESPNACAVIVGKTTRKFTSFLEAMKTNWYKNGIEDRIFVVDEVPIDKMPLIYQSIDVVCCPARYEGFGLVPIEAMVSGTAVIASRTGAYSDMIISGSNGELIDCGSHQQLLEKLRLVTNTRATIERYKSEGMKIVQNNYTLEKEVDGNRKVYEQLWNSNGIENG